MPHIKTFEGPWHLLDVGSIWMKEFASALAEQVDVIAWEPRFDLLGAFNNSTGVLDLPDPPLRIRSFVQQRGYARPVVKTLLPYRHKVLKHLLDQTPWPSSAPLVCTTPYYADVAEHWQGPVIYYSTDLTWRYEGLDSVQVKSLDRRLCQVADLVCPNSQRIADYLREEGCSPDKIAIVPNATRRSNVPDRIREDPDELPPDVQDLQRPVLGVLGDLSGNMDWVLIEKAIKLTPKFSWLFIGPTHRKVHDRRQNAARTRVMQFASFIGMKPYGELQKYARCLDAAVLPYLKKEPTYSGSSTRFYEHLAAGRPMLATRGFHELLQKQGLIYLVDTAEELAESAQRLLELNFRDGHEVDRFLATQHGTWSFRALTMRNALTSILHR
jgi:glycosyltransferase involved in cell wall biosynthesis